MMKKNFYPKLLILTLIILITPAIIYSVSGGLINILEPSANSTVNSEIIVTGRVEAPFIDQLNLSVEPFIETKDAKPKSSKISVINGYFNEKIKLTQGLNIIRLSTTGKKHETVKVVFLISPQKTETGEKIGKNSSIVFTSPKELKLNSENVKVTGVVTDPAIKSVDVVIMNTIDFLTTEVTESNIKEPTEQQKQERKIEFKTSKVKNMQFELDIKLTEGLNIILARPGDKPVPVDKMQIMSLVYEKISEQVTLDEPEFDKGNIIIKGKVNKPDIKQVRINITALVEDEIKPDKIYPKSILDKVVNVEKDGKFYLKAPLKDKKGVYTIRYTPTITVYADSSSATKTLIKWQ